jgi:hypothetical protein
MINYKHYEFDVSEAQIKTLMDTVSILSNRINRAILYLSKEIDGDSPAIDQILSEAIRILED